MIFGLWGLYCEETRCLLYCTVLYCTILWLWEDQIVARSPLRCVDYIQRAVRTLLSCWARVYMCTMYIVHVWFSTSHYSNICTYEEIFMVWLVQTRQSLVGWDKGHLGFSLCSPSAQSPPLCRSSCQLEISVVCKAPTERHLRLEIPEIVPTIEYTTLSSCQIYFHLNRMRKIFGNLIMIDSLGL